MPTLIKRDDDFAIDLLDEVSAELPAKWNAEHVGLRITEGFAAFRHMQVKGYSTESKTAWPNYMYEFDDLVAQGRINAMGEVALEQTQKDQNRTRVSPSMSEITRAVEVCYWPMKYLYRKPDLCEAVNAVSLAHALGLDAGWVTRRRGGYADTWRMRHDIGCSIIAVSLTKDRVSVF